jgi:FkbM family methyltransferase
MKKFIKSNSFLYNFLIYFRDKFRIIYNQKRRSRFLWNLRKGDSLLSFDYPLNQNSIFFDIGAHVGNFSTKMYEKFECNIYAFEPLDENFKILTQNLNNYKKIKCFQIALLNFDGYSNISSLCASASLFDRNEGSTNKEVVVKSFETFITDENIKFVDFVKMNIEGSEYDLLNDIIDSGNIKKIQHLQIQFHNFVDDSETKRKMIRNKLKKTHKNIYNFPFIWERWDLVHNQ